MNCVTGAVPVPTKPDAEPVASTSEFCTREANGESEVMLTLWSRSPLTLERESCRKGCLQPEL